MNKAVDTGHISPRARDRQRLDRMEGIRKTLAYMAAKAAERGEAVTEDVLREKLRIWNEVMSGNEWSDPVKVSAEILIGSKRYRECLERVTDWDTVMRIRARLEVFELIEKIMSGK